MRWADGGGGDDGGDDGGGSSAGLEHHQEQRGFEIGAIKVGRQQQAQRAVEEAKRKRKSAFREKQLAEAAKVGSALRDTAAADAVSNTLLPRSLKAAEEREPEPASTGGSKWDSDSDDDE